MWPDLDALYVAFDTKLGCAERDGLGGDLKQVVERDAVERIEGHGGFFAGLNESLAWLQYRRFQGGPQARQAGGIVWPKSLIEGVAKSAREEQPGAVFEDARQERLGHLRHQLDVGCLPPR